LNFSNFKRTHCLLFEHLLQIITLQEKNVNYVLFTYVHKERKNTQILCNFSCRVKIIKICKTSYEKEKFINLAQISEKIETENGFKLLENALVVIRARALKNPELTLRSRVPKSSALALFALVSASDGGRALIKLAFSDVKDFGK
jgi:hypothetical protein